MSMLRVGLAGCGHISGTHLLGWRKIGGVKLAGVYDPNMALAQQRQREFGIARVCGTFEELLEVCDVIDICSPPQTHRDLALQVVRSGKDLLIEKPVVTDVHEWEEIKSQLEEVGTRFAVIHNAKFAHSVQLAKRWIEEDRIGEVIRLHRDFLTSPAGDRMLVGNGHWSHQLPGGRWFETLPHELYLIHFLVGALDLSHVWAAHASLAPAGAPADEVTVTMSNERCLATIHYSARCRLNRRRLTITGAEGVIVIDLLGFSLLLSRIRDARWKRAVGVPFMQASLALARFSVDRGSFLLRKLRGENPHAAIIRAFAAHLRGEGPSPTPLDEVDYVVRYCDLIGHEIDARIAASAEV